MPSKDEQALVDYFKKRYKPGWSYNYDKDKEYQKFVQDIRIRESEALNTGLDQGLSFEEISAQTGMTTDRVKEFAEKTRPGYGVGPPSNLEKAGGIVGNVVGGIKDYAVDLGKDIGSNVASTVGSVISGERRGPGAEEIIRRQELAKGLPSDIQNQAKDLLSEDNLALLEMVNQGRSQDEIKGFLSEARKRKSEADKKTIGTAVEVASMVPGGGGLVQALKQGGKQFVKTASVPVLAGAAGNVGSELRTNPESTAEDLRNAALVGGGFGLGADLLVAGLGAGIRKTPKSAPKTVQAAGKVSNELDTALAKIDDPEMAQQLRLSFGGKSKEIVARRKGVQTSRAKQFFDTAEREIIDEIEASDFTPRSGQVQSQADTLAAAAQRGPMSLESVQVGAKVDAIDVARARLSMSTYIDDYKQAIESGADDKIRKTFERLQKAREGYQIVTGEAGRALNIQGTFDDRMVKVFDTIAEYQDTIASGQSLSDGQKQVLNDLVMEAAEASPKGSGLADAIYAGDTSLVRKLEEYATAAKLTSPVTHFRNIVGNTMTFGYRAAEQTLATSIGAVRGRTSFRAIPRVLGTKNGYKHATGKFFGVLKDAALLRQTADEGTSRLAREGFQPAIGGKLGEAVRIPFKLLEAADEFGKTILRDSRLNQEAFDLATKEGLTGDVLVSRVDELVRNPTTKMRKAAEMDALVHTFQNPLGPVGSHAQKMIMKIPGGKFFVPFIKTPTNIVKFQLGRSVAGAPGNIGKAVIKRGTREGDEALARAFLGTTLSLGTYGWVHDNADIITGAAPKGKAERDAFYASGKQAYSIKIGNRWISYQNFQPMGMYLLQAKSLDDAINEGDDDSAFAIASSMAQVAGKGLLELPFVQGMNSLVETLGDPEAKGEDFIARAVQGTVPNIVRDMRLYADPIVRAPKNLKEKIYDMIPGLSDDLEARRTILGDEATRKDSPLARSFLRAFGTTEQLRPKAYDVLEEVAQQTGYSPGTPYRTQRNEKLSDERYVKYENLYYRKFNDRLSAVITQPWFTSMSAEDKRDEIQKIVRDAGSEARDEFFKK